MWVSSSPTRQWGDCWWPPLPRVLGLRTSPNFALAVLGHICWWSSFSSFSLPFNFHFLVLKSQKSWMRRLVKSYYARGRIASFLPHKRKCVLKASTTYLWIFGTVLKDYGSLSQTKWYEVIKCISPVLIVTQIASTSFPLGCSLAVFQGEQWLHRAVSSPSNQFQSSVGNQETPWGVQIHCRSVVQRGHPKPCPSPAPPKLIPSHPAVY